MSTATTNYADLLRAAINQAKANAPGAVDDLLRCASTTAEAVTAVTGGAATLELVLINQGENAQPTYQFQLRKVGSEAPPSDLGVYCVTAAGYPVLKWWSRNRWESRPDTPDEHYPSISELEGNFRWMISKPESRLVVLVTFFAQEEPSSPNMPARPA